MHRTHLELNDRPRRLTRWAVRGALLVGCALAVPAGARATVAPAVWARTLSSTPHSFSGGTFSPSVAPTITQKFKGANDQLGWSAVTFSGSATVSYVVTRSDPVNGTVIVCTGADTPVVNAGTVTCTDKKPPKNSLYSEQPVILVAGAVTWSLAPSTPA